MRRLLLLRHAKAEPPPPGDDSEATDHRRPLAPRGFQDAGALGASGAIQTSAPTLALVSTARRTRETMTALGLAPPPETRFLDTLFLAEPDAILAALRAIPEDTACAILVGHNPGLHTVAHRLARVVLPPAAEPSLHRALDRLAGALPTCGLVGLDVDGPWQGLGRPPTPTRLAALHLP